MDAFTCPHRYASPVSKQEHQQDTPSSVISRASTNIAELASRSASTLSVASEGSPILERATTYDAFEDDAPVFLERTVTYDPFETNAVVPMAHTSSAPTWNSHWGQPLNTCVTAHTMPWTSSWAGGVYPNLIQPMCGFVVAWVPVETACMCAEVNPNTCVSDLGPVAEGRQDTTDDYVAKDSRVNTRPTRQRETVNQAWERVHAHLSQEADPFRVSALPPWLKSRNA